MCTYRYQKKFLMYKYGKKLLLLSISVFSSVNIILQNIFVRISKYITKDIDTKFVCVLAQNIINKCYCTRKNIKMNKKTISIWEGLSKIFLYVRICIGQSFTNNTNTYLYLDYKNKFMFQYQYRYNKISNCIYSYVLRT